MVGVGKLMKQAARMQQQMQELQAKMAEETLTISSGGGAITVTVTLQQELQALKIDPEFLKEDPAMVEETLLEALREALNQSKAKYEAAMGEITEGMQAGGLGALFG